MDLLVSVRRIPRPAEESVAGLSSTAGCCPQPPRHARSPRPPCGGFLGGVTARAAMLPAPSPSPKPYPRSLPARSPGRNLTVTRTPSPTPVRATRTTRPDRTTPPPTTSPARRALKAARTHRARRTTTHPPPESASPLTPPQACPNPYPARHSTCLDPATPAQASAHPTRCRHLPTTTRTGRLRRPAVAGTEDVRPTRRLSRCGHTPLDVRHHRIHHGGGATWGADAVQQCRRSRAATVSVVTGATTAPRSRHRRRPTAAPRSDGDGDRRRASAVDG